MIIAIVETLVDSDFEILVCENIRKTAQYVEVRTSLEPLKTFNLNFQNVYVLVGSRVINIKKLRVEADFTDIRLFLRGNK